MRSEILRTINNIKGAILSDVALISLVDRYLHFEGKTLKMAAAGSSETPIY
jgi:hypothetical protein